MTTIDAMSELMEKAGEQFGFDGRKGFTVLRGKEDMNQPALFNIPKAETPSPTTRRRKAMDAATKKAGEAFRNAFTQFVLDFLKNGPSDGETIRKAYLETRLPRPHSGWQGVGGIYAKLRRDNVIKEVGKKRSEIWANDLAVVALVKVDA
jgi:hypothetical protein